jgi:hypothetical protein
MGRWAQPLLLTASVLLSLPSTSTAHPANHHPIHAKAAGSPSIIHPIAYKRQDDPQPEITPLPVVKEVEAAEPTATVPFEAPIAAEDPNDWRSVNCESDGVKDHTQYGPDRWRNVDAGDAWNAVIEGWKMNLTSGRQEKNFANNVSTSPYIQYVMII